MPICFLSGSFFHMIIIICNKFRAQELADYPKEFSKGIDWKIDEKLKEFKKLNFTYD
jgi:hypothetical protein